MRTDEACGDTRGSARVLSTFQQDRGQKAESLSTQDQKVSDVISPIPENWELAPCLCCGISALILILHTCEACKPTSEHDFGYIRQYH